MSAPDRPMVSGLVMRKARDANGVAADAEAAVTHASTSSGSALPTSIQRKFESSLGTDLSSVRVHTGEASADAASSVSAKAYTIGNEIHFGAGHYDPASSAGEHLLAHEVAHTVQQRGGSPMRQNKLEVSSAGDAFEVEADRAADAMVSGATASVGSRGGVIAREKGPNEGITQNSYNRGDLHWEGGTALQEDEARQWAEHKVTLFTLAGKLASVAGISLGNFTKSKIIEGIERRMTADLDRARRAQSFYVWQSKEGRSDQKATNDANKVAVDAEIAKLETQNKDVRAVATVTAAKLVGTYAGYASSVISTASQLAGVTGVALPSAFKSLGDMTAKVTAVTQAVEGACAMCDRTALDAFSADPNFQTCAAWGKGVGDAIKGLEPVMELAPEPWGPVLKGLAGMPAAVIQQFTEVVRDHYARVDAMVADTTFGNGKVIPPGQSGGTPPPPER